LAPDMYLPIICEAAGRRDTSGPGFLGGHRANEDGLLGSGRGSLACSYAHRILTVYAISALGYWIGLGMGTALTLLWFARAASIYLVQHNLKVVLKG